MSAAEVSEQLWERAFQLSYFVLMDRSSARECVTRALEKLVAQQSREKRRAYWRGRKQELAIRRISRPAEDTLQWLVCLESEVCEREQESQGSPTEADMVVRYVKHLAQMTTVSSSFHVNVGFNRLLRSYTTPEVQQIYELAAARYPATEEYRKAKGKLLNQLVTRFGGFLRTRTAQYGEVQFESHTERECWSALVEECLERFGPWSSRPSCLGNGHTPSAASKGHSSHSTVLARPPDRLETSRCHWFMHSTCYGRLAEQLGFDPPEERLAVPRFLHHDGDPGSGAASIERRTAPLSDVETRLLRESLTAVVAHRDGLSAGPLKIIAHGTVCATLVPGRSDRRSFEVPEGTRLLEVWSDAARESRIVATHWIDYDDDGLFMAGEYTIGLHGGRQLALSVAPAPNATEQDSRRATVTIESQVTSAVRQWLRSLGSRWVLSPGAHPLRPVFASLALVVLGVLVSSVYFESRIAADGSALGHLKEQVSAQQAALASLEHAPPKDSPHQPMRYAFSADLLNLRGPRGAGEPVVAFPPGESLAVLELPVNSGEHGTYRVTLSSFPEEQERLSEATLRPLKSGNRWIVEFALPTALVESDTHYLLTLTPTAGTDSARYLFEVRKNNAISTH